MIKFSTVGALREALENIPDNYKIELCVDDGLDGKAVDNSMSSNSPIRFNVWEEEKVVFLNGSEYTSGGCK